MVADGGPQPRNGRPNNWGGAGVSAPNPGASPALVIERRTRHRSEASGRSTGPRAVWTGGGVSEEERTKRAQRTPRRQPVQQAGVSGHQQPLAASQARAISSTSPVVQPAPDGPGWTTSWQRPPSGRLAPGGQRVSPDVGVASLKAAGWRPVTPSALAAEGVAVQASQRSSSCGTSSPRRRPSAVLTPNPFGSHSRFGIRWYVQDPAQNHKRLSLVVGAGDGLANCSDLAESLVTSDASTTFCSPSSFCDSRTGDFNPLEWERASAPASARDGRGLAGSGEFLETAVDRNMVSDAYADDADLASPGAQLPTLQLPRRVSTPSHPGALLLRQLAQAEVAAAKSSTASAPHSVAVSARFGRTTNASEGGSEDPASIWWPSDPAGLAARGSLCSKSPDTSLCSNCARPERGNNANDAAVEQKLAKGTPARPRRASTDHKGGSGMRRSMKKTVTRSSSTCSVASATSSTKVGSRRGGARSCAPSALAPRGCANKVEVGLGWGALWAVQQGTRPELSQVVLLRSVFEGRPPVVLFSYSALRHAAPRATRRTLTTKDYAEMGCVGGPPAMHYCHMPETHEYNAVLRTLHHNGFCRTLAGSKKWTLCWGINPKPEVLRGYHPMQRTNHFPSSWHLGRKDLLWRNIHRMQRRWPAEFDITPMTYVLPDDMRAWDSARDQSPDAFWIWKPVNSSCGRGIRLLRSALDPEVQKALTKRSGVVQRYIPRPLLLHGYKFDLRLYIVVTSFDPLKVYLNSEGLVRLATQKYSSSANKIHHRTMHLTNYSVNKQSQAYVKNLDTDEALPAFSTGIPPLCGSQEEQCTEAAVEAADEPGSASEEEADATDNGIKEEGAIPNRARQEPSVTEEVHSSKWSLLELQEYFESHGLDYELMMSRIKDLLIKALLAVEPTIVSAWHCGANFQGSGGSLQALRGLGPNQTCFEVYGFDVLVDEDLRPWLLEVNTQPSLSSSSPLDRRIKTRLMADVFTLVGFCPFDYRVVEQVVREEREGQICGRYTKAPNKSHTINSLSSCNLQDLGEAEWATIMDAHDEFMRRGALERIFPTVDTKLRYAHLFDTVRYTNLVLAKWLENGGEECFLQRQKKVPAWVPELIATEAC